MVVIRSAEAHADDGYCPVVHAGPWLDRYLEALRRLGRMEKVAIGGLVPHLLNSAGAPIAKLDVHNRRPGVYYLRPTIELPQGLTVAALTPPRVRVVITAAQ